MKDGDSDLESTGDDFRFSFRPFVLCSLQRAQPSESRVSEEKEDSE